MPEEGGGKELTRKCPSGNATNKGGHDDEEDERDGPDSRDGGDRVNGDYRQS